MDINEVQILLVEDNPTDAELEIRELRQAQIKFEVKCVDTREAFLAALNDFKPDVIISDYALPQFNGLEALRLLKELDNDTPFILCIGTLTEEVAVECMKEGAADYILKTSLKRLPSAVLNALENRDARRAKKEAFDALRRMNEELERRVEQRTAELVETNLSLQEEIAERQRSESALQGREKELADFVDNAPIGLHWVDGNGIILWTNKAELDLLGYAPEEYIGYPIADFHADSEVISDILQRLTANEELHDYEARLRCKDGSIKYVHINSNVYWEDGKFAHTCCFTRDITERRNAEEALRTAHDELETRIQQRTTELIYANDLLKDEITEREQAQEKLRESEEWLNALLDASRDGIVVEDDGKIIYINQSYARQLKYDEPEELIGRHIADFLPPDEAERLSEFGRRRLRGENAPSVYQFTGLCKDGTTIEVEGSVSSYVIGGKKYIMTVLRDITERKQIEEMRLRRIREATLRTEVSTAIGSKDSLPEVLGQCAEALVKNLDAAFARIWILDAAEKTLELRASAGLYTHLDGAHSRIPIGKFKIGKIARTKRPHLTNDIANDTQISDREWARAEGITSFAGYPLMIENRVIGVVGMFARAPFFDDTIESIETFTDTLAQGIERKRAEQEVVRSEQRYRQLGEGIMHQVWTALPDGKLDYVNQRTLDYFGRTGESVLKDRWEDVVHPDDLPLCIEKWTHSLQTGEDYEVEFRLRGSNGEYRWHSGRATAGRDPDGKIIKWFGTNTDINDKKLAEEELKDIRSRLQAALEAGTIATWRYDILNNKVFADKNLARLFSVSPKDADGGAIESYLQAIHPDDRRHVEKEIAEALESKNNYECEYRVVQSGGETRAVIARGQIERDATTGTAIRMPGVVIDITEQKIADAALRKSEHKLRTLLGNMSEGLLQVDNNEAIEYVNDRFCEMTGYGREEILGSVSYDFLYDDDGRKFINEANRQRVKGIAGQYELRLRKKSGEMLYAIVGGVPIINADGDIAGTMGVFTDITERKRAEDQLLHDAFHDGLTGLANRALFTDHLQREIERGKSRHSNPYAVLFLDFDRFKIINDSLGHAEGDKLLKCIAERLKSSVRIGDLVARLGGDEFVILLSELVEPNEFLLIAERIQNDLKAAFEVSGREIFISASIGIALSATGYNEAQDMVRDADIAMYYAKGKGKAQYRIFDSEMHENASKQLQIETEMRHALEREEFKVHYQPIINLETDSLEGFESLIRWWHPQRSMIPPFVFIPAV